MPYRAYPPCTVQAIGDFPLTGVNTFLNLRVFILIPTIIKMIEL